MGIMRWRQILEVVGVASVVGGLLLVAFEVRQANRIARAQVVMELSSGFNEINSARFIDADFARLVMLLANPESQAISELDESRITGLAYQIHNVMWAAQTAYDDDLLGREDLENYRNDLAGTYDSWPGIVPALIAIYETQPGKKDAYVFGPLAEWAAEAAQCGVDLNT